MRSPQSRIRPFDTRGPYGASWELHARGMLSRERYAQRVHPLVASRWVEAAVSDPFLWSMMLGWYERLTGLRSAPPTSTLVRREIVPRLQRAFRDETWVLVPREEPGPPEAIAATGPTQAASPAKAASAPRRVLSEEDYSFVEFKLVDEQGQPIAGLAYEIRLPDGRKAQGSTDARGSVRFDRIPFGDCSISFPSLDSAAVVSA
ncbi:MAG TPA: hypothetical protein VFQ61_33195 [Polyangiaceae bacterium]|nr:hypothetical protein [Polyangiaceae bacterium]